MRSLALLFCLSLLGLGCLTTTTSDPGQSGTPVETCTTCKHNTAGDTSAGRAASSGGGSSGSAGSGAAASSGGTTVGANGGASSGSSGSGGGSTGVSSGGSSGGGADAGCTQTGSSGNGSAGGVGCPYSPVPPYDGGCPSGAAMRSTVVDISSCTPLAATVSAIDANGVPVAGTSTISDQCGGAFSLCTPPGGPFSLLIQAIGYPGTYSAEMTAISSGSFPQIQLVPSNELFALESVVQGVKIDTTKSVIVVGVTSESGQCSGTTSAGWTYALTFPDGGAFPDGGYFQTYEDTTFLPDTTLKATSELGAGIFFNVDPTLGNYVLITATNPNPGYCDARNSSLGFTGRVVVEASTLSYDAFLLP